MNASLLHTTNESGHLFRDGEKIYSLRFLRGSIVRVQFWPHGSLQTLRTWSIVDESGFCNPEGRASQERHHLESNPPEVVLQENSLSFSTDDLEIRIPSLQSFSLQWIDKKTKQILASDNELIPYTLQENEKFRLTHTLNRNLSERYYGFGEKSGPLDKHSRRMRMRNTDAFGYNAELSDPLYKHVPFYITFSENGAYGIFYDTSYDCEFDMGTEIDNYYGDFRRFRSSSPDLDYYFIYGPTIENVVEKFTLLTGRIPLPPKWTLGYLGSAMRYTDAPNAQEMLASFVGLCNQHKVPVTGFHLSSGYTMSNEGKRYVFTWNRDRVPNPSEMARTFHDAGIQAIANIKPAMLTTHPRFDEASNLFIQKNDENSPDLCTFWGGEGAHFDFTNPDTIKWWKENVKSQLLEYGIDCTWNDNNEWNIRSDDARCFGFGNEIPIKAIRPIQTLLMVYSSFSAQTEFDPHRRPFVLTRAGCTGVQRYAASWSGDNRTSWNTLKYNIPMGLGASLSGFSNTGHDIGGFAGDRPEPELLVRWAQNGIFSPRCCIHSWRTDELENSPWMYPSVLPLILDALKFRQSLVPYMYTLLWESSRTGHPVIRPLVYHFPNDSATHGESFDFLLGPYLLVANVYKKGKTKRKVYLPKSETDLGWYNWFSTGEYYSSGQVVVMQAELSQIPLLSREGAIVPIKSQTGLSLYAFPHKREGTATFVVYDDDGNSNQFRDGVFTTIACTMKVTADSISLSLSAGGDVKCFRKNYSAIQWVLPEHEARSVNGVETVQDGRRTITVDLTY